MTIIGRIKEQKVLTKLYHSKEAEFVALYGRRRIGKTYLIREFFEQETNWFVHVTGIHKGKILTQITQLMEALSKTFFDDIPLETPSSWDEAFKLLHQQLIKHNDQKVVIFLDELPWLATRKSDLLQVIDHYWNQYWTSLKNVILIVCGSSASWLIKNIIYNQGGLHNRVTCEMQLRPFNLIETQDFLKYREVSLNNRHVLSLYMALGGVPYYLKYVERGLTAEQNIQHILFDKDAPLKEEFSKLFKSLFEKSEIYIELVTLLAKTKSGLTRAEIEEKTKFSSNGGRLSERLRDLCAAGFIEEHIAWQKKTGEYYKLVDEFSLFYLQWLGLQKNKHFTKDHWLNQSNSPAYKSWSGCAFESLCMKHIDQIIKGLNIDAGGSVDSWRFIPRKHLESGAQIDLLINRNDNAISLCEIKYTNTPFSIDKQYFNNLKNKIEIFKEKTKTNKQIFVELISASGIKKNNYSKELVSNIITLDDLFKEI